MHLLLRPVALCPIALRLPALALLLAAPPAQAQLMTVFEGLFSSVNTISFYTQGGALLTDNEVQGGVGDFGVVGLGTEVLLNLPSPEGYDLELGLGAGYLGGFEATDPTLDFRGAVRALPTIAVYASRFGMAADSPLQPYLGLGFGFTDLWNARGYDEAGAVYPVGGETFEAGATAGLYFNTRVMNGLFVEASYRYRKFESLVWETEQLPAGWPRSLDASTVQATVGWQFRIRHHEAE